MARKRPGSLIIIGGHEDRDAEGECAVLREVAERTLRHKGPLVIVTVATSMPEEVAAEYKDVFGKLGVKECEVLDVRIREDAHNEALVRQVERASAIFLTGGDQLRITSQIGDSPVFRCMRDLHARGGTLVGTSAGAAALSQTMIINGKGDQSSTISGVGLSSGLGFLADAVIDSHFAERGRIGRLLGAVAQNPRNLGLGIDEDTAVVVEGDECFKVVGSGGVYVVDGADICYSSLSDERPEGILSIYNVRLHVLSAGDEFDLKQRQPLVNADERTAGAE